MLLREMEGEEAEGDAGVEATLCDFGPRTSKELGVDGEWINCNRGKPASRRHVLQYHGRSAHPVLCKPREMVDPLWVWVSSGT